MVNLIQKANQIKAENYPLALAIKRSSIALLRDV